MKRKVTNFLRIFFPIIMGSFIGLIINGSIDYNTLIKPPASPPSIVFPIAWSILYLLIGISYYLFRKKSMEGTTVFIYYLNLIINFTWSIIFFTLKMRLLSIIWIIFLAITIIILILKFKKESKSSFYLLIPYLIWTIYATYINIGVYILN